MTKDCDIKVSLNSVELNTHSHFHRRSQAPDEVLKPEEARYQWLENELLHTVKTDIQQKIKQSNKVRVQLHFFRNTY